MNYSSRVQASLSLHCIDHPCVLIQHLHEDRSSAGPRSLTSSSHPHTTHTPARPRPPTTPSTPTIMDCSDGVCRLVPKSQRIAMAAAAVNDENAPPTGPAAVVQLPPVKVGDVPPMPLPLEPLLEEEMAATTVQALTQEKGMVVVLDLWSTACVRCPEALGKVDAMAAQYAAEVEAGRVLFAAVNIDDRAKGAGMVQESGWSNLCHFFIAEATKAVLKARFGLAAVPFCMVFDKEGRLVAMGSPKQVPLETTLPSLLGKAVAAAPAEQQPQQSFTLDEDF